MPDRPYTLLSCGMSIDGYLGSARPRRLELSNDADFDRVDAVRASCDAILVGAATVRTDNPRLLVRSKTRREDRDRHQRHERLHRRRQHEEDDDREEDLHHLAREPLPCHGAHRAADIVHVATVADPAVDVAHDPARHRDVDEQRPVVRRHRGGQRQLDAEAAGHDLPTPGAAQRGHHRQARGCRQRSAVERADAVEERARA